MTLSPSVLATLAAAAALPGVSPVALMAQASAPALSTTSAGTSIAPAPTAPTPTPAASTPPLTSTASTPAPTPTAAGPVVPGRSRWQPAFGRWQWPLSPRPALGERFDPPEHRYGTGHRGLDLQGRIGQEVHAVAAGTVTHAGVIAGRGSVTVLHADGVRSTYEPLAVQVHRGDRVEPGQVVGTLTAGHCPPGDCLHLGAIRDEEYVDPLALLPVGQVVLLPMGGGRG